MYTHVNVIFSVRSSSIMVMILFGKLIFLLIQGKHIYRYEFCVLILYPANFTNSFIKFGILFSSYIGFLHKQIHEPWINVVLLSPFQIWFFLSIFFLPYSIGKRFHTMLNKDCESRHASLTSVLKGKTFSLLPVNMI